MNKPRYIEVHGYRQIGKTERMVWLAAGIIVAGGRPLIVARTSRDREQTWKRLFMTLQICGYDERLATSQAQAAVVVRPDEGRGVDVILREVDD